MEGTRQHHGLLVHTYKQFFCHMSVTLLLSPTKEGYCWTRTGERQASRLRARYLKAVLRQDVGYFDLHVTSISEVITSVSSDSLVIQDVISEKVPVFVMNVATFLGAYVAGFLMLWRLAIVGLPFVVLLVIPGLIYGRTLMGIARKMRDEYNKARTIVEQAISSIRTVYSFVGESKTITQYSAALQGTVNLGLKQGLAKGLAIGSNGLVFAIWAFMSYYGSRMVMYHGAHGGTIFAVGAATAVGGLSLGAALSNVKYFSEATAAGERIIEIFHSSDGGSFALDWLMSSDGCSGNKNTEISKNSSTQIFGALAVSAWALVLQKNLINVGHQDSEDLHKG